jgi:hypothetical protein
MKAEDWIKVEDVLPKDDSVVLAYDERQGVLVADYDRGYGFSNYEHGVLDYVTHWMPLELPNKPINEN